MTHPGAELAGMGQLHNKVAVITVGSAGVGLTADRTSEVIQELLHGLEQE
jgi:hypothetical protein